MYLHTVGILPFALSLLPLTLPLHEPTFVPLVVSLCMTSPCYKQDTLRGSGDRQNTKLVSPPGSPFSKRQNFKSTNQLTKLLTIWQINQPCSDRSRANQPTIPVTKRPVFQLAQKTVWRDITYSISITNIANY